MEITETIKTTFSRLQCCSCGVFIFLSTIMERRKKDDHSIFWCPNGHQNYFPEKSRAEVIQEELDKTRMALSAKNDQLKANERDLLAMKQRVCGGACPYCKRQFRQLKNHIANKHPEKVEKRS